VTILGDDRTGDTFIFTNASEDEALLRPGGEVAWVVPRPGRLDIRLVRITSSRTTLVLHRGPLHPGPLLAPSAAGTAINYFGTIGITLERGFGDNSASVRTHELRLSIRDEHDISMPAFVAENPRLSGRPYYNLPSGEMLHAPLPQ
jgi:hypothetical protein